MKRVISAFIDPSMPIAMGRVRHQLLARWGHCPILVYTMGKVGSSTVAESLRRSRFSSLVYHVHFLSSENLNRIRDKYERAGRKDVNGVKLRHLITGKMDHMTSSRILSSMSHQKTYVVTLVRDPIDMIYSHVFQNPKIHRPFLINDDGTLSSDAVEKYVAEQLASFDAQNDHVFNWFNHEFEPSTGIDVYEHPFDTSKGYTIIRDGIWNVAILALDKLDDCLPQAIQELTGRQAEIAISKQNVREQSKNKELYQGIKDRASFPREQLQQVYATRYAQHFFSPEQIGSAIDRWSAGE